jgi:D-amino-acid dehydrogenase
LISGKQPAIRHDDLNVFRYSGEPPAPAGFQLS